MNTSLERVLQEMEEGLLSFPDYETCIWLKVNGFDFSSSEFKYFYNCEERDEFDFEGDIEEQIDELSDGDTLPIVLNENDQDILDYYLELCPAPNYLEIKKMLESL